MVDKYDNIIVDEDPIKSIITNQGTIAISDLKLLQEIYPDDPLLAEKIRQVLIGAKHRELFSIPSAKWREEDNEDMSGIDISSFMKSEYFIFRKASAEEKLPEDSVSFIKPVEFKDGKYLVLSATANEIMAKYYFGADKVEFDECLKLRNKGKIVQFYDRSISRSYLADHPNTIKDIQKKYPYPTITYKDYSDPKYPHFGDAEGRNDLTGQTINVIGCNHQPEWIYKLFAYSCGLDFDMNAKMRYQEVELHGYRFWFTTYDDYVLRSVQFFLLEESLSQAVGRARVGEYEDCTVYVFSDFIFNNQVELRESDYDDTDDAKTKK